MLISSLLTSFLPVSPCQQYKVCCAVGPKTHCRKHDQKNKDQKNNDQKAHRRHRRSRQTGDFSGRGARRRRFHYCRDRLARVTSVGPPRPRARREGRRADSHRNIPLRSMPLCYGSVFPTVDSRRGFGSGRPSSARVAARTSGRFQNKKNKACFALHSSGALSAANSVLYVRRVSRSRPCIR